MWHTADLTMQVTKNEWNMLCKSKKFHYNNQGKRAKLYCNYYKDQGVVVEVCMLGRGSEDYQAYLVKMTVNFSKLLKDKEHIELASDSDNEHVISHLEGIIAELFEGIEDNESPVGYSIELSSFQLSRLDYTLQVRGLSKEEIHLYLRALQKGDVRAFKAVKDRWRHEIKQPYKDSFYMENDSVTINIYDKQSQVCNRHYDEAVIQAASGILRIEIQCKAPKLGSIKRRGKYKVSTRDVLSFLSSEISEELIKKYLKKITKTKPYYPLDTIKTGINKSSYRKQKKDRLLALVQKMSKKGKRLSDVWKDLYQEDSSRFRVDIAAIEELGFNPIPLPEKHGLPSEKIPLPNLLDRLFDGSKNN